MGRCGGRDLVEYSELTPNAFVPAIFDVVSSSPATTGPPCDESREVQVLVADESHLQAVVQPPGVFQATLGAREQSRKSIGHA